MEFENQIKKLSDRIEANKQNVTTEEATKTSFILPFLSVLGYDIFDPNIIVPEFTADIGTKKGEKVDYAIIIDSNPLILIEAKSHTQALDRHKTQLERYFTVTDSKFAILTNGIEYWFYSDLEDKNRMDNSPFLTINMLDLKSRDIKELEKFQFEKINIDNILNMAGVQKYVSAIKDIFTDEIKNPSDDFAKLFASRLISKSLRHNIVEEFKIYTKQAFSEIINDLVSKKISSINEKLTEEDEEEKVFESDDGIVTTEEELEGFYSVRAILSEFIDDVDRIAKRDTKSYFGILLDDNNRKWLARLHFNTSVKYLEVRIGEKESKKYKLENIKDIYNHKEEIINTLNILK